MYGRCPAGETLYTQPHKHVAEIAGEGAGLSALRRGRVAGRERPSGRETRRFEKT
jgi:hypothetical protein